VLGLAFFDSWLAGVCARDASMLNNPNPGSQVPCINRPLNSSFFLTLDHKRTRGDGLPRFLSAATCREEENPDLGGLLGRLGNGADEGKTKRVSRCPLAHFGAKTRTWGDAAVSNRVEPRIATQFPVKPGRVIPQGCNSIGS
jgi:hypothetical protein